MEENTKKDVEPEVENLNLEVTELDDKTLEEASGGVVDDELAAPDNNYNCGCNGRDPVSGSGNTNCGC